MNIFLTTPLKNLKRVGPKYGRLLKKVGLETIQDLLFYLPHRYEDLSLIKPIVDVQPQEKVTIQGQIINIQNSRSPKKRLAITEALINDRQSSIRAVWFNQPFLIRTLQVGKIVNLAGKVQLDNRGFYLSSPAYEIIQHRADLPQKTTVHTARLVPIYHETNRLSSRYLRYLIKPLLPLTSQVQEWLPPEVKQKYQLLNLRQALRQIHFPENPKLATKAKERLSFEEMFLVQLLVLNLKRQLKQAKAQAITFDLALIKKFIRSLPFKLTNAQRRAAWEIIQDLKKPEPMNRLLEGDVGSGKTVVASIAALQTIKAGYQVAFIAPTEILAQQHFKELNRLLKNFRVNLGLLTSGLTQSNCRSGPRTKQVRTSNKSRSTKRTDLLTQLTKGQIQILVGTHALLEQKVQFKNLALVIIDEQHRFGVKQRARLVKTNQAETTPHLLSMSATPIPRSLALTIYGDLDLSLLDEMPQNRRKIITQIVSPQARGQTYQFIENEIKKGRQCFVICPRIESQAPNEEPLTHQWQKKPFSRNLWHQQQLRAEIKAVTQEYQKLSKNIFPRLKIAMLHGQLPSQKKQTIMQDFKQGNINILIATSVVEVGIDVPNATVMMIEGAECFGLAQLHQFRGRVGRSSHQSYCFVFTDSSFLKARQRLKALLSAADGFGLAEKDLEIRGPGQFFGSQQSGLPDLAMESLANPKIIYRARQAAQKILTQDPKIKKYPLLKEKFSEFKTKIHLE